MPGSGPPAAAVAFPPCPHLPPRPSLPSTTPQMSRAGGRGAPGGRDRRAAGAGGGRGEAGHGGGGGGEWEWERERGCGAPAGGCGSLRRARRTCRRGCWHVPAAPSAGFGLALGAKS